MSDENVRRGFACVLPSGTGQRISGFQIGDIRSHSLAHLKDPGTGGVRSHIPDEKLGTRNEKSGGYKIGGGRDIPGDADLLGEQLPAGLYLCGCASVFMNRGGYVGAEAFQHQFRMIAGKNRLRHRGLAVGIKPCKENGGFDLGGCNRRVITDASKYARFDS